MRYGMTIPLHGVPLHAQRDWIRELADLGYTDVWSSEGPGNDAFTPLALASEWAPALRLGTAICSVYTRGPALLASSAASSRRGGARSRRARRRRIVDVIVEGWNGIPFEKPYARVRDTLRFLRRALAGEKVTRATRPSGARLPTRRPACPSRRDPDDAALRRRHAAPGRPRVATARS